MKQAVIYARVSSKDQEREGYSIPAQLKLLREYARTHDFEIAHEFVDVETAKITGRKQFGQMVRFFRENAACRVAIVEKTDRLYRNFRDCVTLEDLEVEIHLPKEGQVIGKDSKSQAKLVHGIQVVIARNYIENLREEVRKGMREKAEQGIYPSRPPLGYRNNKLEHTIEVDSTKSPIARRMFDLYASGQHSLNGVRKVLKTEFGIGIAKGYLERLLNNPFYKGQFIWEDKQYSGTHTPLVSAELFEQVQTVFRGHNKPKYRKHDFAFAGLLRCAYDNCAVTAELQKNRYTYYRCTGFRGKCELPYFREEELGSRLGKVLQDIHIPDDVLAQLEKSLLTDKGRDEAIRKQQGERLKQRLSAVRHRLDQAYLDKLDGRISEEFWTRKSAEWIAEEQQIPLAIQGLANANPDRMIDAVRIFELANKAHFLYVSQPAPEKAKLLRMVLSNCSVDAVNIYPSYKKPFDLIFARAKNEEWRTQRDSKECLPLRKHPIFLTFTFSMVAAHTCGIVPTDSDKLLSGHLSEMKLFGRKGAASARSRTQPADGNGDAASASHRLTLDLARANTFAAMLAHSRASRAMEVTDLLAGMYICNWERLSRYWPNEDQEEIEGLLRGICRISPQRWHAWLEMYDREKSPRSWRVPRNRKKEHLNDKVVPSGGLAAVLKRAEEIAPYRDAFEGRSIPILTSECVLLCILRSFGSEVSRRLQESGLDATRLEREALIPRRAPLT